MEEKFTFSISLKAYHFRRKGNEAQFTFNITVEEHVEVAKQEIKKLALINMKDQAGVRKALLYQDEGLKAIRLQQKHIKR